MTFQRTFCFVRVGIVLGMVAFCAELSAQVLAVQPVNIFLHAGEQATTLGITNQAATDTAVQVRVYQWQQKNGVDQLTPTSDVLVSPPIATISSHETQIVRLVQRSSPAQKEVTYRILVDQIPSAASAGMVRIVLRLSIPIFAEPMMRANPQDHFQLKRDGDHLTLIGINEGNRHDTLHKLELHAPDGLVLQPLRGASPYLLEGSTQRWQMTGGKLPDSVKEVTLTATGINGAMRETVPVVSTP